MAQSSRSSAYQGRESGSTRNPHSASAPATKQLQEWARLPLEQRIVSQWRAAFGCPVSDEAKTQFCITALGRTFRLSDVRLWTQHHPQHTNGKEVSDSGKVHLEFFFDGSTSELSGNDEVFSKAFEDMIETQLQERRVVEFRKRLAARRRRGAADDDMGTGGEVVGEEEWKQFLHKPIPATDFSIRSYREAGCMLTFIVCQTSLSVAASEVLGQIAFQEHFPIDGVAQAPSASTKPLPQWVYYMGACTASLTLLAVFAWWQVVRQFVMGGDGVLPAV